MNFFIGLISQAYEDSVQKHVVKMYQNEAGFNNERNGFYSFFTKLQEKDFWNDVYILKVHNVAIEGENMDDEEDEEVDGIIKKVDRNIKKET